MNLVFVDIAKEIVVVILTAGLSTVGHCVIRLARDVNAFFGKVRDLEKRIEQLEGEDDE